METTDTTTGAVSMGSAKNSWMFPVRVALNAEGFFEIWTKLDNRIGSRNNFALAIGIQHQDQAEWICNAMNFTQRDEILKGDT